MADDLLPKLGQLALGGAAAPSADGSSSPPPPLAAAAVPPPMPLGTVLDPLLATKSLDPVDLLTLGCVNKDLSLRVREFWAQAEQESGYQARFLRTTDDDAARGGLYASVEFVGRGGGIKLRAVKERSVETLDLPLRSLTTWRREESDCCRVCDRRWEAPFWWVIITFRFDVRPPGHRRLICYDCFRNAKTRPAEKHTRAALFRLAPCDELMEHYITFLPRSIVEAATYYDVSEVEGGEAMLAGPDRPLASVRRVAAFALMKRTPRALHEHWRKKGLDGWV